MVSGRTHAQELSAARSQRSLRHADLRAKRRQAQMRVAMCGQGILEPHHDIGMMAPLSQIAAGIADRQAIDKSMNQLLLESSRDFRIRNQLVLRFRETTDLRMVAQQTSGGAPWRPQYPALRWRR